MKTFTSICLFAFSATLLSSCSGHQTATQLLNDPKKKAEILTAICNDKQVLGDFTSELSKNEAAIQTVSENKDLIRMMMVEHRMSGMMEADTAVKAIFLGNMVSMAAKDSLFCDQLGHAILRNHTVKSTVSKILLDAKDKKEKKHKEHKEHKEAKEKKKDKHKKGK